MEGWIRPAGLVFATRAVETRRAVFNARTLDKLIHNEDKWTLGSKHNSLYFLNEEVRSKNVSRGGTLYLGDSTFISNNERIAF